MAHIIQHVCLYCRRRFRGSGRSYILHLKKHRQWFHKYRYQLWKSDIGQKQPEYSKDLHRNISALPKEVHAKNDANQECNIDRDSSDSTLSSFHFKQSDSFSTDQEKNEFCQIQIDSTSCRQNKTQQNEKGLRSMVASSRHTPTKTEKKLNKCSFCEKTFSGGSHLLLHERTHTGEKPHMCRFCPKSFAQKGYLKIHERIHTGERPFSCGFCKKAFCTKEDLRRHERIHTGEKPYKCKVCGRGFSQRSYRNKHETIHSGERPFASKPPNLDLYLGGQEGDSQSQELPSTLADALKEAGLPESLNVYNDGLTPEMFEQLKVLPEALQQEFLERLTSGQGKGRGRPKGSTNRANYNCRFCGRDCRSSSQLKQHERTHTGEKPFSCQFCHKSFSQQGYARIHERIHTGERPYSCDICNKAFGAKEDLRRHQRTHTGEKPYKCEVCGKAFAQNSALIGHRKTHINDVPSLDYSSHSFVALKQPHASANYGSFLGPNNMPALGSAHMLHMMATEISGVSSGRTTTEGIVVMNSENSPKKAEFVSDVLPQLPGVPSVGETTEESGRKVQGINDIADRLLSSNSAVMSTSISQDQVRPHTEPPSSTQLVDPNNFSDYLSLHSKLKQQTTDMNNPYNMQKNREMHEMSITDHIRMQLSIPVDERSHQHQAVMEATHKGDQQSFITKKNKIDNLASLLLSAKTSKDNDDLAVGTSDQLTSFSNSYEPKNKSIFPRYFSAAQQMQPNTFMYGMGNASHESMSEPSNCTSSDEVNTLTEFNDGFVVVKKEISQRTNDEACNINSDMISSSAEQTKEEFVSKKNKIEHLASHLLSAKTSLSDPSPSTVPSNSFMFDQGTHKNTPKTAQPPLTLSKSIDSIAAQLLSTKAATSVSSPSFDEEMSQGTQYETLPNMNSAYPNTSAIIKPSITSIFRPLQGIPHHKTLKN